MPAHERFMKNNNSRTVHSSKMGQVYDEKWTPHGLPTEVNEMKGFFENLDVKDKLLLDLGAGTLRFSLPAIQKGAKQVVAVDMLPGMLAWGLAKARSIGAEEKVNVIVADVRYLPFLDNTFDVAGAIGLFEHVPSAELFVKEAHRVLKKSGTVAIDTWNAIPKRLMSLLGITRKELEYWLGRFYYRYYYPWEFKRLTRSANFSQMKILGTYSTYFFPHFGRPRARPLFFIDITVDKLFRKLRPLNQVTGQFLLAILQK